MAPFVLRMFGSTGLVIIVIFSLVAPGVMRRLNKRFICGFSPVFGLADQPYAPGMRSWTAASTSTRLCSPKPWLADNFLRMAMPVSSMVHGEKGFAKSHIEQVRKALATMSDQNFSLTDLLGCLQNSSQTVLSQQDLDRVASAVVALEQPPNEKPIWPGLKERGFFFVFEGLDRSGKSTQSKMLAQKLGNAGPVRWISFPNRSIASGVLIDMYLQKAIELPDKTVHLLFSANRWEIINRIVEDLNRGISVVCDRYAFSGVAYSAAKGLDFSWCRSPDIGLPVPDAVFFLQVDESVGAARASFGDERYENADMQERVRNEFRKSSLRAGVDWHDVDGAREIQEIHTEITAVVDKIMHTERAEVHSIQRLWVDHALV